MTDVEIVMSQLVAGPVEQVYVAWTDAATLATWWWPQIADTTYEVDARVGGAYAIRSGSMGFGVHGTFVALDPPHRLQLTWVWEDEGVDGPEERVHVELEAREGATLVTVRHATEAAGAPDFRQGWTDCLGRLAALG